MTTQQQINTLSMHLGYEVEYLEKRKIGWHKTTKMITPKVVSFIETCLDGRSIFHIRDIRILKKPFTDLVKPMTWEGREIVPMEEIAVLCGSKTSEVKTGRDSLMNLIYQVRLADDIVISINEILEMGILRLGPGGHDGELYQFTFYSLLLSLHHWGFGPFAGEMGMVRK